MENESPTYDSALEVKKEPGTAEAKKGSVYVALVKHTSADGGIVQGWIIHKDKGTFQNKLTDGRITEVVHIFKGKELDFSLKNVVWFD